MSNVLNTDTLTQERQQVLEAYDEGLTVREIADKLGLSTQRIYQQLKKLELPAPGAKETE